MAEQLPKATPLEPPCPFHLSYDLVAVSSQVLVQPGQDYMQFRVEHEGGSVWSLRRESDEALFYEGMLRGIRLGTQIALILRGQQP